MSTQLTRHESTSIEQLKRDFVRHYKAPIPHFENAHQAVAYALWEREAAATAAVIADRLAKNSPLHRGGMVLTEKGWEIPVDAVFNPRVIEHDPKPVPAYELAYEAEVQRQVKEVADSHEHAVKRGDVIAFIDLYKKWELPFRFYLEPVNATG